MQDVMDELVEIWCAGGTAGVATVVDTWRSAPRQPGASMLVAPDGSVVGSVSGGCVESAVYDLAGEVVSGARPTLQRFGVSDSDALVVGLTCGGVLDVYVEPISQDTFPELGEVAAHIASGHPVAIATVVDHEDAALVGHRLVVRPETDDVTAEAGSDDVVKAPPTDPTRARIDAAVLDDARGLLSQGCSAMLVYGPQGERRGEGLRVFVESFSPPPRLLVFGAIDFASAVAEIGAFLGYRVTVCDARATFATPERLPAADEVVVRWPHRYLRDEVEAGRIDGRTVLTVLTHDPKFDVPLLELALRLDEVAYVGAMGSRRTHEKRLTELREAGLSDAQLARLSSPIGLDLGARTPQETAVSIAAEIISLRWGGQGERLSHLEGPIHRHSERAPD